MTTPAEIMPSAQRSIIVRRVVISAVITLLILSPALEGVFQIDRFAQAGLTTAAVFIVVMIALGIKPPLASRAQSVMIAIVTVTLTVAVIDLIGRSALADTLNVRPENRIIVRWTRLPSIPRLMPNIEYDRVVSGDLSNYALSPEDHDPRRVRFITDEYGFRNTPPIPDKIDTIDLGDSYGMGSGTSQEATLTADLQASGRSVYNLSIGGSSPWQEYVNFAAEADRLKLSPGSVVLWLLFTGNDLGGNYGRTQLDSLPWEDPFGEWLVSVQTFRAQSPLRQIAQRIEAQQDVTRGDNVVSYPFINGKQMLFKSRMEDALTLEQVLAHRHYPSLVSTIQAMTQFTRDRSLQLAIIVIPTKNEVYRWVMAGDKPWSSDPTPAGFGQAVQQIALDQKVCFIDLKSALIKESERAYEDSGETLWWYDDAHWNSVGQAFTASLLRERLCLDAASGKFCCQP